MGSRLEKGSNDVRKRIENHTFNDEQGEEYQGSTFGGFSDYMRRKKIKLQNLDAEIRQQSSDKPQIFRGIVAQVNGYTQPSLNDLHVMIVSHGGGFLQYLDGKTACTHIIASQLTPKKKAEFARYRIVKPAWIVDSVNAGKLLPWDNYRLVDEGVTQKILGFDNGQIVSQVNNQRQSYRSQTDTSWYTSQLKGKLSSTDSTNQNSQEDHGVEAEPQVLDPIENAPHGIHPLQPKLLRVDLDVDEYEGDDETGQAAFDEYLGDEHQLLDERLNVTTVSAVQNDDSVASNDIGTEKRKLTAEEHNAILLQNPHMAKSSTANPDFLNQYYRESRLHHLSSWKADLKAQLQARTMAKSSSLKARPKRLPGARRYIMHVDFDSFFAAVSLRSNPHLIDQPVVIAHGSGPGSEIASCNYPARKFGVKNGMWMKYALEMCPNLKVLPYDYKAYEEASRHFYDSILSMDGVVQSISIDEALIDVSAQCIEAGGSDGLAQSEGFVDREQSKANELAQSLRTMVKQKTECDVSVGIGGNILLAKVALRRAKPAGQHQILPEDILEFVGELQVTDLPGVANSLGKKLEEIGVKLVKDIRGLTKERLTTALGPKTGEKLWDYSRGIDRTEVGDQVVRKSVSAEINWGIRFVTQQQAEDFVQSLCDELNKRLLENGVKGKQLTMKIMRKSADAGLDPPKNLGHGKCDTFNKSVVLGVATNEKKILGKEAISILRSYGFSPGELRGLGVQMQKLEPIKPVIDTDTTLNDSSQRRLTFKKPKQVTAVESQMQSKASEKASLQDGGVDTIEEMPTFEGPLVGTIAGAIRQNISSDEKPLNMLGTQFMLPSQYDPSVMAELPDDIRSKLAPKQSSILDTVKRSASPASGNVSRSNSPYLSDSGYGLPSQSQLDPEALAALPDDVKEEVMAHYRGAGKQSAAAHNQSLMPQSPRKVRPAARKTMLTPTKKQKTSSIFGRSRVKSKHESSSTLTQSNFLSIPKVSSKISAEPEQTAKEVSQSFLDELPEDIRVEILTEQKRNRMKAKSGLNLGTMRKKPKADPSKPNLMQGQQTLQVSLRPEIPTFTSRKLSTLPELREAMSAWVQEFSGQDEQGPFEEDTSALALYLSKVVTDEQDIAKATSVIEWLAYLIDDWPFDSDSLRSAWMVANRSLKSAVQFAVSSRGLPPVAFESMW